MIVDKALQKELKKKNSEAPSPGMRALADQNKRILMDLNNLINSIDSSSSSPTDSDGSRERYLDRLRKEGRHE